MQVEGVAFAGRPPVVRPAIRPAARAVDGLAVGPQPVTDFLQAGGLGRFDHPVRPRADVQQPVAVVADDLHQHADAQVQRMDLVVRFPAPLAAQLAAGFPQAPAVVLAHTVFDGLEISRQPASAVDQGGRLMFADELEKVVGVPVLGGEGALGVEPDDADVTVLRAELLDLGEDVLVGVAAVVGAVEQGADPVALGVVEAQHQPPALAGVGQFLADVAFEGAVLAGDLVVADLRVEVCESVVMLGREDDVLHAGVFGDFDPLVGVELGGVELLVVAVVHGVGHTPALSGPTEFLPGHAAGAPVDEQAELHVAEAPDGLGTVLRGRRGGRLGRRLGLPCACGR